MNFKAEVLPAKLLTFQLLDVRLYNTKLIDTGADNVERVVDSILYRSADSLLYLCVAALRRNLALQLLGSEHFCEFMTWCAPSDIGRQTSGLPVASG